MQLDEFVSETLQQLMTGVHNAQEHAQELGGQVNPHGARFTTKGASPTGYRRNDMAPVHLVEFDVALTVAEGQKVKGGLVVLVAGLLGAGARAEKENTASRVSRVRFAVPVMYPELRAEDDEEG